MGLLYIIHVYGLYLNKCNHFLLLLLFAIIFYCNMVGSTGIEPMQAQGFNLPLYRLSYEPKLVTPAGLEPTFTA